MVGKKVRKGTRTIRVDAGYSPLANPYDPKYECERAAAAAAYGELLTGPPEVGSMKVVKEVGEAAGYCGRVVGEWNGMAARMEVGRLRRAMREGPLRVDESVGGGNADAIVRVLNGEWMMEGW